MIQTMKFNNLIMGTLESGYLFGDLTGLGSPSLKVDIKERGSTNGADLGVKLYGRRVIGINMMILGQNPADYELKRRALELACDITGGLKRLEITTRGGLLVHTDVIPTAEFDLPYKKGQLIFSDVRLELTAPFPFFESPTTNSNKITFFSGGGFEIDWEIDLDMSNGGTILQNITNNGNTYSYPTIILNGQIEDATLTNETNGESFSLDYNLADGSQIVIDTYNRTILLNGTTNIREYFSGDWIKLNPGSNGIKLNATSNGVNASVFVNFKDTYLGI